MSITTNNFRGARLSIESVDVGYENWDLFNLHERGQRRQFLGDWDVNIIIQT
jgi:hypothetical protein